MTRRNKVHPNDSNHQPHHFLTTGANNMGKNVALAASLPLGYVWLPVSCCAVMPTVKYALGDEIYKDVSGKPKKMSAIKTFGINLAGMIMGCMSLSTGACCLGCCGTMSPTEIYT